MKTYISRSVSEPLSVGCTLIDSETSELDTCFLHPLDVLHTDHLHDMQAYEVDVEACSIEGKLWTENPSRLLTVTRALSIQGLAACAAAQVFERKDVHILEDSVQPTGTGQGVIQALQQYKGHVKTEGERSVACTTGDEAGVISTGRLSVACATGRYTSAVSRGPSSAAIATGTHAASLSSATGTLAGTTEAYSVAVAHGLQSAAIATGFKSVAEVELAHSTAIATGGKSVAAAKGCLSVSIATGDASVAWAKDDDAVAISTGYDSQAKGALGSWLILVERDTYTGKVISVVSAQVDGEKIRENIAYTVRKGEVVEKG